VQILIITAPIVRYSAN